MKKTILLFIFCNCLLQAQEKKMFITDSLSQSYKALCKKQFVLFAKKEYHKVIDITPQIFEQINQLQKIKFYKNYDGTKTFNDLAYDGPYTVEVSKETFFRTHFILGSSYIKIGTEIGSKENTANYEQISVLHLLQARYNFKECIFYLTKFDKSSLKLVEKIIIENYFFQYLICLKLLGDEEEITKLQKNISDTENRLNIKFDIDYNKIPQDSFLKNFTKYYYQYYFFKNKKPSNELDGESEAYSDKYNYIKGFFNKGALITGEKYEALNENGDKFVGQWADEYKTVPKGKITYANGDVYEGQTNLFEKSGQGKLTYKDGSYYIGEFKKNQKNGLGLNFNIETGTTRIGEFEKDAPAGAAFVKYTNNHQECRSDDNRNPYEIFINYSDGAIYCGGGANSKLNGRGIYYNKSKNTIQDGFWENSVFKEVQPTTSAIYFEVNKEKIVITDFNQALKLISKEKSEKKQKEDVFITLEENLTHKYYTWQIEDLFDAFLSQQRKAYYLYEYAQFLEKYSNEYKAIIFYQEAILRWNIYPNEEKQELKNKAIQKYEHLLEIFNERHLKIKE